MYLNVKNECLLSLLAALECQPMPDTSIITECPFLQVQQTWISRENFSAAFFIDTSKDWMLSSIFVSRSTSFRRRFSSCWTLQEVRTVDYHTSMLHNVTRMSHKGAKTQHDATQCQLIRDAFTSEIWPGRFKLLRPYCWLDAMDGEFG